MTNIILTDLIPIFVIMILGYVSGKRNAFSAGNASSFNKLVLNYALPAALFASIVKADRAMLFSDVKLLVISLAVIIGLYFWAYFSCQKFFKRTKKEAAVCGLIAGAPTIGFLGFAVLSPIYGSDPTTGLVVAVVAIVVNAVAVPLCLYLLNPGGDAPASGGAAKQKSALVSAVTQPVVLAPLLAVLIVILGIKFPPQILPSFDLIAKANAGVAVFAAGLTLSSNKFEFDKEIFYNSFIKLILMPAAFLVIGKLFGMGGEKLQMLVLAGALPPVFSGVIIGSRFQIYVRTGTSSLAFSTLLFMLTAPLWIYVSRLAA